jgi:hypothetical protein
VPVSNVVSAAQTSAAKIIPAKHNASRDMAGS